MAPGNNSDFAHQTLRLDAIEKKRKSRKKRPRKQNKIQTGGGNKIDIAPALRGLVKSTELNTNAWILKLCLELQKRGVPYDSKWGFKKLQNEVLMNEHGGNISDSDDGKLFYPRLQSFEQWSYPEVNKE